MEEYKKYFLIVKSSSHQQKATSVLTAGYCINGKETDPRYV
jgi:hypothetical protein